MLNTLFAELDSLAKLTTIHGVYRQDPILFGAASCNNSTISKTW